MGGRKWIALNFVELTCTNCTAGQAPSSVAISPTLRILFIRTKIIFLLMKLDSNAK